GFVFECSEFSLPSAKNAPDNLCGGEERVAQFGFEFVGGEKAVQHHLMSMELLTESSCGFLQLSPDVQECSADPRHFRLDLLRIDLQGLRAAFQNVSRHPGSGHCAAR